MTNWLQRVVAAYRPAYLRGLLLDEPCHPGPAQIRESVASAPGTAATPPHIDIDTMSFRPAQLERSP